MKRLGLFLLAVVTVAGMAACGVNTFALKGSSTSPRDELYTCAVRQLQAMDYEIGHEDRNAGLVRGQKFTAGWWQLKYGFWGGNTYDGISVTVVDGQDGAPCMVHASGETYVVPGNSSANGVKSHHQPSNQVQTDIDALLSMCKVGDINAGTTPKN